MEKHEDLVGFCLTIIPIFIFQEISSFVCRANEVVKHIVQQLSLLYAKYVGQEHVTEI